MMPNSEEFCSCENSAEDENPTIATISVRRYIP
jgi:hypothetical protein